MSGGGRHGFEEPYVGKRCTCRWFSTPEICKILERFNAVIFIGDHHEHWDGKGYPHARAGEHISVGGRILAAAEAFDSLISRRPYREPMSTDDAVERLRRSVGTHFDSRVFEALRAIVKRRKTLAFVERVPK